MGCADQAQELARHGLKPRIEAVKKRLQHKVLSMKRFR
jgi:hypothetical protein